MMLGLAFLVGALWWIGLEEAGPQSAAVESPEPERLVAAMVEGFPHDRTAFTQGLLWYRGSLYESTGLYGRSSLRRVDPATGEIEASVTLPREFFGEGLARVEERLIQLTWREGVAFVRDRESLEELDRFHYEGEGWGLCHDGRRLVMSDGTSVLTFREPATFDVLRRVEVTLRDRPVGGLNELECAEGWVYANVYGSDKIVRIDPEAGRVAAIIDASDLLRPDEAVGADVLNGIAYDPQRQVFYLTGKLWPRLFEVRFVVASGSAGSR